MRGRAQRTPLRCSAWRTHIQQAVEEDLALNDDLAYKARQQFMYGSTRKFYIFHYTAWYISEICDRYQSKQHFLSHLPWGWRAPF